MAIYHFSAKIISRASGSSALAAAAYRSASRLHDQRLDRHHDFSNKAGVVHSEVLLPDGAPEYLADREKLWNAVEACELRKDAQLAREIEFAIPRELNQAEGIRLAREFVQAEFVDRGMVADLNVHWDIGADGEPKPHAHVMLALREVDGEGFGKKNRDWKSAGYQVQGLALSGIAAENLQSGSGIASRTIASIEHQWGQGRELLTDRSILVIDEAGMIGSRQMERVIAEAEKRRAKVVLVGDPEQLQAIEAGAAFRSIAERHGAIEITDIRRQREDWQRLATRQLATGRTAEALEAYQQRDALHPADTREAARAALVDRWDRQRQETPDASRIILTHSNAEVAALNQAARGRLRAHGELGEDVTLQVEKGERHFAAGDRVMFGRNERSLGVKNGSLGRIESVTATRMAVLLDNGGSVAFDLKDYAAVDHGYAATVHKAQGVTVDQVHVLATPAAVAKSGDHRRKQGRRPDDRHGEEPGARSSGRVHFAQPKSPARLARDAWKERWSRLGRPHRPWAKPWAQHRDVSRAAATRRNLSY